MNIHCYFRGPRDFFTHSLSDVWRAAEISSQEMGKVAGGAPRNPL